MSDLQRIRKVINWLIYNEVGFNDNDISEKLGYTKSSFSQIVNGKTPISDKFLNKLCSLDRNINIVWIKDGTGLMFKEESALKVEDQIQTYNDKLDKKDGCKICAEKDIRITELKETIAVQKQLIQELKKQRVVFRDVGDVNDAAAG